MIRNLIVLFVRNLRRQKLFSIINLLGLTVSIASNLLIYLYVSHEFSYDSFHHSADRLYRVNQTFIWGEGNTNQFSRTGPGVAHAMKEEFAEVEAITSLHTPGSYIISYTRPDKQVVSFEETEVLAADSNFFKVLNFPLIQGDASSAFINMNTLMMTRSTASKYFGDSDPIGKLVRIGIPNDEKAQTYEVTGVIEDVPSNSTIQFDVLLSSKNFDVERMHWSWIWTQLETFVRLTETADIASVNARLSGVPKKRAEETLQRVMNTSYDEYVASGKKWELFLQPITTLHLPEHPVVGSFPDTGNIKTIYSLIGAAIFITLLSCINFMNLSTAQFTRRVKEAGIRTVLGLGRPQLSLGYFVEALIFCSISLITGLAVTQIILPGFNLLTGKNLNFDFLSNPVIIPGLLALVVTMAAFSSAYPAIFLSSFRPVEAIKGKLKSGSRNSSFRNGLVVFQFSVSIILIVCTAVVFQQLRFISEKDLGFDKENVIRIKHAEGVKNAENLVSHFSNIPGVVNAARCTSTPPEIYGGDKFTADGLNGENFSLNFTTADERYVPTLGIELRFGRNFSKDIPSDVNGVILNEATLKKLNWPADESVIGRKILYAASENRPFEIIGVMADFNYWSLATEIEPMAIFHIDSKNIYDTRRAFVALRIEPQSMSGWQQLSSRLTETWQLHAGDIPFEYGFIDDYFADTFKSHQRFGVVLLVVAALAILIASLGLLGMIIYALQQRTKEIGIRKVAGATTWNILSLISRSYLKLILIAIVAGSPVAWFMMSGWLEDFSYRVSPSPWIFAGAGVIILIIAFTIIGYHSLKAATTNPVDVLKDE